MNQTEEQIFRTTAEKINAMHKQGLISPLSNYRCDTCGRRLTEKQATYSNSKFRKPLCFTHQGWEKQKQSIK